MCACKEKQTVGATFTEQKQILCVINYDFYERSTTETCLGTGTVKKQSPQAFWQKHY
jgi:hypothetical protein